MKLFWNPAERRLTAVWRLLIPQVVFWLGFTAWNALAPMIRPFEQAQGLTRLAWEALFFAVILAWAAATFTLSRKYLDRRPVSTLGLDFDGRAAGQFVIGLGAGFAMISLVLGIEILAGWSTVRGPGGSVDEVPLIMALLMAFIRVTFVAGWEETVFRAGLIPGLAHLAARSGLPSAPATAIALALPAVLFGAAHLANPNATVWASLAITLAGLLTAVIYVRSGSLALPIGAHLAWNFAQGHLYGMPVSGQTVSRISLLQVERDGPVLWTGGAAGPEAGLVCALVIVGGAMALMAVVRPRRDVVGVLGAPEAATPGRAPDMPIP